MSSYIHVLPKMSCQQISHHDHAVDVKEMYQEAQCMCSAVTLLMKTTFLRCFCCCRHSGQIQCILIKFILVGHQTFPHFGHGKLVESELLWLSDNVTVQTRIMKLRATRGTCNPNLQIAVTQMYGPYVASIHMEFHEE